jgi:PAS domain S-box-containing protein
MTISAPVEPADVYRRRGPPSLLQTLTRFPVLAVLDASPEPVLAVGNRGAIIFCNKAFAEMIGHDKTAMLGMNIREILLGLTLAEFVLPFLHARGGTAVNLIHAQGWVFQAQMSASAMQRDCDEVMLSTFTPAASASPKERREGAQIRR